MDSTSIDENLVEESVELMVVVTENNSRAIIRKAYFLNPRVTTIDGSEPLLRPSPSPDSKISSLCVSFKGWKLPNKNFKSWATKMAALHKSTWLKSGVFEAIEASTYRINKNPSLILSLVQKWCPQTKSFVFPWGEATITLEDVNVLLGFPVSGLSVFAALESSEMEEAIEKLEERRQKSTKQVSWISSFVDDEMEHEAFLVLWLSKFVFPDKSGHSILRQVFPIAVRLARGERVALAPAVLATLYRDLGEIRALASTQLVSLESSLFKLVQVWIWERFKNIRPKATEIPSGKPRIAQWSDLKQRSDNVGVFLLDDFDWRPYTKPLKNWIPPRFYLEEAKWMTIGESLDNDDDEFVSLARCMRVSQLVGIGFVENYYPNRVAMQFGLDQDLPGFLTCNNFGEKEAWEDYHKSQDGLKLYVPSRLATASVTARYRDWWMESVSEMWREPTETCNTVDHYDDGDDDVSAKLLPLSQVLEKCGDGVKEYESLTYKRRKLAREDDESAMNGYQTQNEEFDDMTIAQLIKSREKCCNVENAEGGDAYEDDEKSAMNCSKTKDDDDITIAQMIKSRKKDIEAEKTAGERRRIEDNVPDLPQKLAYGDKTVAATEIEEMNEETDENNCLDPINGVAEKEEEEDYVIHERKLAIMELALKIEARMLVIQNTLSKIKQWKIRRNHTKTPASA